MPMMMRSSTQRRVVQCGAARLGPARCSVAIVAAVLLFAGSTAHAQNTKSTKSTSESTVKPGQATGKPGTPSTAGMGTAKYPDGQQPPSTAGMGTGKHINPNAPVPGTATMKPPPQPAIPRGSAATSGKP